MGALARASMKSGLIARCRRSLDGQASRITRRRTGRGSAGFGSRPGFGRVRATGRDKAVILRCNPRRLEMVTTDLPP